jgi:hypothetical protein
MIAQCRAGWESFQDHGRLTSETECLLSRRPHGEVKRCPLVLQRGDDAGEIGVVVSLEQLLEGGDNTTILRHVVLLHHICSDVCLWRAQNFSLQLSRQNRPSDNAVVDQRARLSVSDTSRLDYFQHCITCSP